MTIGILGGMGSYATLDIFRRLLEVFPAQKEWDRPRVLIDNNCVMPSRVVAALYGTDKEKLVQQMSASVKNMVQAGCTHIFFACNTSHIFLEDVLNNVPQAKGKIFNIIDTLACDLSKESFNDKSFALVATEGTVETHIYQKTFAKYGLPIVEPAKDKYECMRDLIEAVKQNKVSNEHCERFIDLAKSFGTKKLILGCTEFPVIYYKFQKQIDESGIIIYDPINSVLQLFKQLYDKEGELECKR